MAIPTRARSRPVTASPATGRGGLGVGLGWTSSLTRPETVIVRLLDRPDRHRGRVSAEGRAEVVLRQLLRGAVADQRLQALVERVRVGRSLGVDGAVLLSRLVLADHLELAAGRLRLRENDRGVEEVRVDLAREQA